MSGAVGGNVAGAALKKQSLGTIGNSLVGILGGGAGYAVMNALNIGAGSGGALDPAVIATDIGGGGIGGAILLLIIAIIRKALKK